jgi:hypothetical protein
VNVYEVFLWVLSTVPSFVKSHAQLVGDPVDMSENWTVNGSAPVTGVAENRATGAVPDGADTVIYPLFVSLVLP